MSQNSFLPSTPTKVVIFFYFPLPLLDVNTNIIVGDPAVDFIKEVDGVVHRSVEDIAAAIELLGHDTQVPCQSFPIVAGMIILFTVQETRKKL